MGNDDCELEIYLAKSGQWSGRLVDADGVELGGVAGCADEDEVESCAAEAGMVFGHVSVSF
jgi:hypothetical protein